MTKKVQEVIDLIEQNGWVYSGTKGDHRKYKKAGALRPIIIPGKLSDDMPTGTLNSILRAAGLKKSNDDT